MTTAADIKAINRRMQRIDISDAQAVAYAAAIDAGSLTLQTYINNTINASLTQRSTKPALIVTNFYEGLVPTSARLDSLAAFCITQYNSYASQGVANPDIGPYEALSVAFSDQPSFAAFVAGKTIQQIITDAYTASLNTTANAAQLQAFVDQYNYYNNLYLANNVPNADLKAKGAVIGQILYYGGVGVATTYNYKATTWLALAGYGTESYGVAW